MEIIVTSEKTVKHIELGKGRVCSRVFENDKLCVEDFNSVLDYSYKLTQDLKIVHIGCKTFTINEIKDAISFLKGESTETITTKRIVLNGKSPNGSSPELMEKSKTGFISKSGRYYSKNSYQIVDLEKPVETIIKVYKSTIIKACKSYDIFYYSIEGAQLTTKSKEGSALLIEAGEYILNVIDFIKKQLNE